MFLILFAITENQDEDDEEESDYGDEEEDGGKIVDFWANSLIGTYNLVTFCKRTQMIT